MSNESIIYCAACSAFRPGRYVAFILVPAGRLLARLQRSRVVLTLYVLAGLILLGVRRGARSCGSGTAGVLEWPLSAPDAPDGPFTLQSGNVHSPRDAGRARSLRLDAITDAVESGAGLPESSVLPPGCSTRASSSSIAAGPCSPSRRGPRPTSAR